MAVDNAFIGLDIGTLQTLKTEAIACLRAIMLNQSYALNGRTLTRANLNDVRDMIGQLQAAIENAQGLTSSRTYVAFNPRGL